jgi:transposase
LSELTVDATEAGHQRLLGFARKLDGERVWAIEDCRHVSRRLEAALLRAGERVLRVPPKLMAGARKSQRGFGKSDPIDALSVARAALREPDLPVAQLAGPEREIALILDHRANQVCERTRLIGRLRWLLHDIDPDLGPSARGLANRAVLTRLQRQLTRRQPSIEVRIARELVDRIRELTDAIGQLERELRPMVRRHAAPLLTLPGVATLNAAKLIAEVADIRRFRTDAKLALYAGVAPLDASSGKQRRHRLNRTGNRQLNAALHMIALTQARIHPPARDYIARRRAEGKTGREALRALKRHLARVIYRLMTDIATHRQEPIAVTSPLRTCLT